MIKLGGSSDVLSIQKRHTIREPSYRVNQSRPMARSSSEEPFRNIQKSCHDSPRCELDEREISRPLLLIAFIVSQHLIEYVVDIPLVDSGRSTLVLLPLML